MPFNQLYINGNWTDSKQSDFIEVENPTTLEIIESVPRGNSLDVDAAVNAAFDAFESWSETPVSKRIEFVQRALDYVKTHRDRIREIEIAELGAPHQWAEMAHVETPIKRIESFIEVAKNFSFETHLPSAVVRREAIGVIACITPWNYPLGQVVQKVIPAILCGNTVVLKPSQITPLSAYVLAEAFDVAGLPKGVFNLVTGKGAEVGNALATHPNVDMVSFTGSTEGGKEVGKLALDSVKKIALELGGKSACIVLESADYEQAVKGVLNSCFLNTGQTCSAWTRLLVPKKDLRTIEKLLVKTAQNFVVGDPKALSTQVGPLASLKQFEKVKSYIEKGIEEGATLLFGEVPSDYTSGYFVSPTIFTNVNNHMTIAQEEIFGPVLCVVPYETEAEAVSIANDTMYGLSGAIYGEASRSREVAKKIKTGSLTLNDGVRDILAPFGGYKQSGIGREGGHFGFEEFLEVKAIFDYDKQNSPS